VKRTTTGNQGIAAKYQDADNYLKLEITAAHYVRFFARAAAADEIDITCSTTALSSLTTAYHIALLVDRDNSANTKVYVNGVSQSFSVNTVSADDISNTGKLYVGQLGDNSLYFNGYVAQVGIGKPADASAAAVQTAAGTTIYNSGLGQYYTEIAAADRTTLGLTAYWDLSQREYDSAGAVTATDSVGTNHLTMVGAEMVTNGAMSADTNWTGTTGTPGSYDYDVTNTIAAGVMTMACGGDGAPTNCSVGQALALTNGNQYTLAGSFTRTSGTIILRATSGFDPAGAGETIETFAATNAAYSEAYTVTGARTHLLMYTVNSAAASWAIDNVSVRPRRSSA
jgi:hypothetical protein